MNDFLKIHKILIANRGEIAIRVIRATMEMGIKNVAIFSEEDRLALHRFKADEAYQVGAGKTPVEAYLDIEDILRIAKESGCDAVHPGYGFLAENPEFARRCMESGIIFIGPGPDVMRALGNKVAARRLAEEAGVPVIPASDVLAGSEESILQAARQIGFPIMLKASWGGGGRGMRMIREQAEIKEAVSIARREAKAAFGHDDVYFEKLLENVSHVEVQILGDHHGNVVHLFERDCSLQRRHQKVMERAPAPYLSRTRRNEICEAAVRLARHAKLNNAATVEFLYDKNTEQFYFIEVNPRIQVEHTVTEEITGIDIVKAQITIASGEAIANAKSIVPPQNKIHASGHALQCRVTAEDPLNNFIPDSGHIVAYRSPAGPGVRLDGGTAYTGAWINRAYDSLLVKVTSRGRDQKETISRMRRALFEFRIRGVATNLPFLLQLLDHSSFHKGDYNTRFIDETPELFNFVQPRGSVNRLLRFIADVIVNGNTELRERPQPIELREPVVPELPDLNPPPGTKQLLKEIGAAGVAQWLKEQKNPLVTDTTYRDAHQSLLATRVRTRDLAAIAPHYARLMPGLFSIESWGGATFDVALRFLKEDPWARLHRISSAMPNIMQQMLLRSANAVGYKNYPDNVVRYFIGEAARAGVDVFRIFDSLNWVENMRVAIDAVGESGKIIEAALCYSGDILNKDRGKYDLKYYLRLAKELEAAGAHILGIKDMAGLVRPAAAKMLITALKQEIGLPIHFHTHDTSGAAAASVLAAVEAGVDAFDAAIDSMSGLTSQPNMGAIVEALYHTERDTELDAAHIRLLSAYWEQVREQYVAYEPGIRSGASEVYVHEMPGGQYTNLREQARSLGLDTRWPDIAQAYADVNALFGDLIKVTPTSKVVGDMALAMVTSGLSKQDVLDPNRKIAFPASVVEFFRGELGQPEGGFPQSLQRKVLGDTEPLKVRPGSVLEAVNLEETKKKIEKKLDREVSATGLASYLMYPDVYLNYAEHEKTFGDISILPTHVFFYGMKPGDETVLPLLDGRQAIIQYLASSDPDEDGMRRVFFEVNGQPQTVIVKDKNLIHDVPQVEKADPDNPEHVAAPMPGLVIGVEVSAGQKVRKGDTLLVLEAMKMQTTVPAEVDGKVKRVIARPNHIVDTGDLLLELEKSK